MAKHRLADRRAARAHAAPTPPANSFDMVDLGTGTIHRLTRDATADRWGRYAALCGKGVLPAAMVDPGRRYCQECRAPIPTQRTSE